MTVLRPSSALVVLRPAARLAVPRAERLPPPSAPRRAMTPPYPLDCSRPRALDGRVDEGGGAGAGRSVDAVVGDGGAASAKALVAVAAAAAEAARGDRSVGGRGASGGCGCEGGCCFSTTTGGAGAARCAARAGCIRCSRRSRCTCRSSMFLLSSSADMLGAWCVASSSSSTVGAFESHVARQSGGCCGVATHACDRASASFITLLPVVLRARRVRCSCMSMRRKAFRIELDSVSVAPKRGLAAVWPCMAEPPTAGAPQASERAGPGKGQGVQG